MNKPRVSVLTPVYNGERFLEAAVESAMAQTFSDLEVIVVNDGSTDSSGEIAERLAQKYGDRVRVVHQKNGGLVAARNTAIEHSRGELLALLDADDVWLPHHLATMVPLFDQDAALGLAHADTQHILADGTIIPLSNRRARWRSPAQDAFRVIFLREDNVTCPTAVFRRSCVDGVGGFDPAFNRLGCEDRDMWLRIASKWPLRYVEGVHAYYRIHANNMSKQSDKMLRARLLIIEKHSQSPHGAKYKSRALAAAFELQGTELRSGGDIPAALVSYARAARHAPLSASPWRLMLATVLRRYGAHEESLGEPA